MTTPEPTADLIALPHYDPETRQLRTQTITAAEWDAIQHDPEAVERRVGARIADIWAALLSKENSPRIDFGGWGRGASVAFPYASSPGSQPKEPTP